MRGARAVQRSIIEDFPHADISISIVWIVILPGDTEVTARESASMFNDPRVRHFYDPEKRLGKAIARSLNWEVGVAWDIYLFYAKGSEWVEDPPPPTDWMHQLSDNWTDRAHFRFGDALVEELHKTMRELMEVEP